MSSTIIVGDKKTVRDRRTVLATVSKIKWSRQLVSSSLQVNIVEEQVHGVRGGGGGGGQALEYP